MKYPIKLLDNNWKYDVYTGVNILELYHYLEIIGAPTTLTTSSQSSHHFGPSYYTKNYTKYLQTVIAALLKRQKSIW